MKQKFTNLYMRSQRCCVAVDSNRENLCSKIFGMKVAFKWNNKYTKRLRCVQVENTTGR